MKTSVTCTFTFEAAHQLPWHPGACQRLHGHGYKLEVTVSGPLDENGIVVDFADVRRCVETNVIGRYDHTYLNDLIDNPTAELIALDAWKQLEAAGLAVTRVRLWETADSYAEVVAG